MILEERTSVCSDETVKYSDIDVVCQEKHFKKVCSRWCPLLKRWPSELIYCLQILEIQFFNICFCRDFHTTHAKLIILCINNL